MPVHTRKTAAAAAAAAAHSVPHVPPLVEPTTDDLDVGISSNPNGSQHSRSSSLGSTLTDLSSSIGEVPEEGVKKLEDIFARFSKDIENSINDFPKLGELKDARKNIKRMQQQLKEVKAFRDAQRDPIAMVKLFHFSTLTWQKLKKRLGVKPLNSTVDEEGLKSIIQELKVQHTLALKKNRRKDPSPLYPPKGWQHTTVSNNLQNIQKVVFQQNEASARFSINEWILELAKHIDTKISWIVIVPEPVIQTSSSKKSKKFLSPNFASIKFNNHTTALTGVADYILTAQDKAIWKEAAYDEFIGVKTDGASWNDPQIITSLKKANVNVLEAKASMDEMKLKKHLPQVIGQCIQMRQEVPFYLMNSKIWIFGIIKKCQPTAEGVTRNLYEAFTLPTFDIKLEDISEPAQMQPENVQTNYEWFLTIMTAWIRVEASAITQAILRQATTVESEEEGNNEASEEEDDNEASESEEENDSEALEEDAD
ncbi:hypothetical protein BJ912DRAFT_929958 [Pholiota molesta]|nr:hypothetical protein BJ912DRAFT_929958 [Pholiota molesta]